jgi:nitrite reductase/ring-hydroxylating ferredoxin subunit
MSQRCADPPPSRADCPGCEVDPGRREFLRDLAAAGVLLALGAAPREVTAARIERLPFRGRAGGGPASYPIPDSDGVSIDRDNEVILARFRDAIYAFALSCPHQRTMLKWLARDSRFQCPKHKSKYQPDGTFISGRATRHLDRHPVRRNAESIVVDVDRVLRSDLAPEEWAAAVVRL